MIKTFTLTIVLSLMIAESTFGRFISQNCDTLRHNPLVINKKTESNDKLISLVSDNENVEKSSLSTIFSLDISSLKDFDPKQHKIFLTGNFSNWATPGEEGAYEMVMKVDTVINNQLFDDNFESGRLEKWGEVIEDGEVGEDGGNPFFYITDWDSDIPTPSNGSKILRANWGYNINTWVITPQIINLPESSKLSFWFNSSYYWHVSPNPNGKLMVKVSTNQGADWDTLWDWQQIGDWDSWVWNEVEINLSEYEGANVLIAFNLVANDNSTTSIDNVNINSIEIPWGATYTVDV